MTTNENIIEAQKGVAFQLKKGQLLKVMTPEAQQVSDLFCFNAHERTEAFSAGRSLDYNDTIYLTQGHQLYSQRSNVMLTIVEDTCGRHDLLMTPCSLKMFQIVSGTRDYHPSCHENLWQSFKAYDIDVDQIGTTFNIFMNVEVGPQGQVAIKPPLCQAGDYVILKAEMDLIVGLTACSHEETNSNLCKPIAYSIQ